MSTSVYRNRHDKRLLHAMLDGQITTYGYVVVLGEIMLCLLLVSVGTFKLPGSV